MIGC